MLVGNSHLIAGTAEDVPLLLALLEGVGIDFKNNPDVYIRTYSSFGIDEARELRERASSRALGAQRVFIVAVPSMTTEAQNALLKTLEEPPADAMFFFIVASPESLLATLRSRTQMLSLGGAMAESTVDIHEFLRANSAKRLDMLKPLFEKDEDDKRDMSGVLTFLSALERAIGAEDAAAPGLESVYRARKYVGDKGSLVKPLLEQVALLVPVIRV